MMWHTCCPANTWPCLLMMARNWSLDCSEGRVRRGEQAPGGVSTQSAALAVGLEGKEPGEGCGELPAQAATPGPQPPSHHRAAVALACRPQLALTRIHHLISRHRLSQRRRRHCCRCCRRLLLQSNAGAFGLRRSCRCAAEHRQRHVRRWSGRVGRRRHAVQIGSQHCRNHRSSSGKEHKLLNAARLLLGGSRCRRVCCIGGWRGGGGCGNDWPRQGVQRAPPQPGSTPAAAHR